MGRMVWVQRLAALRRSAVHAERQGMAHSVVVLTALLCTGGVVMVASASSAIETLATGSPYGILVREVFYLVLGVVTFLVVSRIDVDHLVRLAPYLMGAGLAGLAAVMVAGSSVNGGRRWIRVAGFTVQPSEFVKFATLFYVVWVLERYRHRLQTPKDLARTLWPVALALLLVLAGSDIGTTSIIASIAVVVFLLAGLRPRLVGWGLLIAVGGLLVYGQSSRGRYALQRLTAFLHPSSQLTGANYQLQQSKIGLGAGGVSGLGFGQSREKWGLLPNPHTDFIFSILGEELGLIGTLLVLGLFLAFLLVGMRIAARASSDRNRLLAAGVTWWICGEALLNMASVVGLWPVTGIPLPFFSYGGSALIVQLAAVAVLYGVARDTRRGPSLALVHDHERRIPSRGPVPATRASRPVPERTARR